ncbi:uncharacterized protein LOC107038876 [Diachasma alloeum]|uniref:uncharacterized protein LOC107038876 n=1 Tax=Diachasma alloeum TaxID=454923 RepID=UPI0007383424|nr:uncharacterized protein LOC107038876 [Diachasma alloeum]
MPRSMVLDNLDPNDAYFQKILHRGLGDDTIQDVQLVEKSPALKKGENDLSYLTRFTLKYTCSVLEGLHHKRVHRVAHLIMKEEPDAELQTLEVIRGMGIFDTERRVLEDVLPKIAELVGKRLGPRVYYSSDKPDTIVMEDLATLGFRNKNRKIGFNEAEMFMVLENIADFHAASVLLNEQNADCVSCFSNGFFTTKLSEGVMTFVSQCVESIGDGVRDWPDEKFVLISDKIKKKSREIVQKLLLAYQNDADELLVLNHGDMWNNNIMFRDDGTGEPEEACFVDYQMCIWTSPAIDLLQFLHVAPELTMKMTHDDVFLQKYLTRLSSTMKALGCSTNPPTLEQLKKSMFKRRDYALLATFFFYPRMEADDDELENADDMVGKGESAVDFLKNPRVRETMAKILPILDERGYLD